MLKEALPTDPLEALGDSLFLHILSHVPPPTLGFITVVCRAWRDLLNAHKVGIWRSACWRSGVDGHSIKMDMWIDKVLDKTTDWRDICIKKEMQKKHIRRGHCKDKWIFDGGARNKVKEFNMDRLHGAVYKTDPVRGLSVSDDDTGQQLFYLPTVLSERLQLSNGFVIFHPYQGRDTLHVYRSRAAICNSKRKYSPAHLLPDRAHIAISLEDNWSPDSALAPDHARHTDAQGRRPPHEIPHRALAFYREIEPPTPCSVFRASGHGKDIGEGKEVLGAAGPEGVYIWFLDDYERDVVTYPFPDGIQVTVQSLEIDDDYIYVSGQDQLHIFNRHTKQYISAFPLQSQTPSELCAVVYDIDLATANFEEISAATPESSGMADTPASHMGRLEVVGVSSSDAVCPPIPEPAGGESNEMRFLACHHTDTDLICITKDGQLYIIQDYAPILAITDPSERLRAWADHTVNIRLGDTKITHSAIGGTLLTFSTTTHLIFLDLSTLPRLPVRTPLVGPDALSTPSTQIPSLRLHNAYRFSYAGTISCALVDRDIAYYCYRGLGPKASVGEGTWIRGWDFGVEGHS